MVNRVRYPSPLVPPSVIGFKGGVQVWHAIMFGGLGLTLSFPPWNFSFLAWLLYVPLLICWDREHEAAVRFRHAYLTHLLFYCTAFYWVTDHVMPHVGYASIAGLLIFPLFHSVPFTLVGPSLFKKRVYRFAALVSFAMLMEWLMTSLEFGIPWGLLGNSHAEAIRFNQIADLGGVAFLSLWIWLLNGIVWWLAQRKNWTDRWAPTMLLIVLLLGPLFYSLHRLANAPRATQHISISLLQPAFTPSSWSSLHDVSRVDTLVQLTLTHLRHVPSTRVILWPETAIPPLTSEAEHIAFRQHIQERIPSSHTLLSGAIRPYADSFMNEVVLLQANRPQQTYVKQRLVPFAEAVPYAQKWPWLNMFSIYAGGIRTYLPSNTSSTLNIDSLTIGPLICFETVIPQLSRTHVLDGAQLLLAFSQDGWWGDSPMHKQHLAFGRLRAIETRRSLLQVTVSGTSAWIDPVGRIRASAGWMEAGWLDLNAPLHENLSFYVRVGPWVNWISAILSFSLLTYLIFQHFNSRQRRTAKRTL